VGGDTVSGGRWRSGPGRRDTDTSRRPICIIGRVTCICAIDDRVWDRAIDVFQALGRQGPLHHRQVRIPDLLIAAAAEHAGVTVRHYDHDFDVIAGVTGQPVRAIAPMGSL